MRRCLFEVETLVNKDTNIDDEALQSVITVSAFPSGALQGEATLPGDKSCSHRALMFASLAVGQTRIEGLLEGEDVLRTAAAMRALGARVDRLGPGCWLVEGRGLGALTEPANVLDMGNSGTAARLLLGLLAGHPLTAVMTGDASLRSRPMARVTAPLTDCGAQFFAREGDRLPITVIGAPTALALDYRLPVASAQVKSAVLLAGLNARGETRVEEPVPTRDHSERMLRHFGAEIAVECLPDSEAGLPAGARRITLVGQPELKAADIQVPADPSSAAFPLVAALLLSGSELSLPGVCVNENRCGLITTLQEMGADLRLSGQRDCGGEPVADLTVSHSSLHGIDVPAARAPSMIDEYPILCVAAAAAEGRTVMRGLAELRVKESDRLALMAEGLRACGVALELGEDWIAIEGCGPRERPRGGATVRTALDHRIAMSFLVLGLTAQGPVTVDDGATIATSFPNFSDLMVRLGADLRIGSLEEPEGGKEN